MPSTVCSTITFSVCSVLSNPYRAGFPVVTRNSLPLDLKVYGLGLRVGERGRELGDRVSVVVVEVCVWLGCHTG